MNILYYCDEYPPVKNGGIGTVVQMVAEYMVRHGHRVFVIGRYENEKKDIILTEENINGVSVTRLYEPFCNSYSQRILRKIRVAASMIHCNNLYRQVTFKIYRDKCRELFKYMDSFITKHHIDLVEIPDYWADFINTPYVIPYHSFHKPVIIRVHGSVSFIRNQIDGVELTPVLEADRSLYKLGTNVSAVSAFSAKYAKDHFAPSAPTAVIYNPIDDAWFESANLPQKSDTITILFFGKLIETKGAISLARAFNQIAEKYPNVRLRMVGKGDRNLISSMISPQYHPLIEFIEYVPHSEIRSQIDSCTFCVLPSYFENFSMAALEVMARMRALVYTSYTSGPELITHGVNGLLVDPRNINDIVAKISYLIEKPDERERIARKGYDTCKQKFSSSVIMPSMENYYQQIINHYETK